MVTALRVPITLTGDWPSYMGMAVGLYSRLSPALDQRTARDVARESGIADLEDPKEFPMQRRSRIDGKHYFRHFFFYSGLVAASRLITALLGYPWVYSFQMANAIILSAGLTYILAMSRQAVLARAFAIVVFGFSVGAFYFRWTHPEILSATCLLVASFAFADQRYVLAVFLASISATQNPSSVLLALVFAAWGLWDTSRASGSWGIPVARQGARLALAMVPAAVPFGWNYLHFGRLSPLKQMIDYHLINSVRVESFLFDLNQGFIVGFVGLVVSILLLLVLGVGVGVRASVRLRWHRLDLLLLGFVVTALPTLAQSNWNGGCAVFLRYAAWSGMPLLAWTALRPATVSPTLAGFVLLPGAVVQVVYCLALGASIDFNDYLSHQPWVVALWDRAPGWYNPEPEIFAERLAHAEGALELKSVFAYHDRNGRVRKVMTSTLERSVIDREVCGSGRMLRVDRSGWSASLGVPIPVRAFYYFSGDFVCAPDFWACRRSSTHAVVTRRSTSASVPHGDRRSLDPMHTIVHNPVHDATDHADDPRHTLAATTGRARVVAGANGDARGADADVHRAVGGGGAIADARRGGGDREGVARADRNAGGVNPSHDDASGSRPEASGPQERTGTP